MGVASVANQRCIEIVFSSKIILSYSDVCMCVCVCSRGRWIHKRFCQMGLVLMEHKHVFSKQSSI